SDRRTIDLPSLTLLARWKTYPGSLFRERRRFVGCSSMYARGGGGYSMRRRLAFWSAVFKKRSWLRKRGWFGSRRPPRYFPVREHFPRFDIVRQESAQRLTNQPLLQVGPLDRPNPLDTPAQIAIHPVGGANVNLRIGAVAEIENAAVF